MILSLKSEYLDTTGVNLNKTIINVFIILVMLAQKYYKKKL